MAGIRLGVVRCKNCSKFFHPRELTGSDLRGYTCPDCQARIQRAIQAIGEAPPDACQECGERWMDMPDDGLGNVPMHLHDKDGIMQLLCNRCSDGYMQRRADLYRHTQFGFENRL
jgi:DNA-directed RNA polymerase subunit RPC12/RpoP